MGASAPQTGLSQAEPEVSALRASIPSAVYDKNGREIMIGDVVKIYHFTAALRRKRHYMYKHVTGERVWPSGFRCLFFSHLTMREDDGFYVARDGAVHADYEIVQSIDARFDYRPRIASVDERSKSQDAEGRLGPEDASAVPAGEQGDAQ